MKISVVSVFVSNIYKIVFYYPIFLFYIIILSWILWILFQEICLCLCASLTQQTECVQSSCSVFTNFVVEALWSPRLCPKHYRHRFSKIIQLKHTQTNTFPSHQRAFFPTAISRRITVSCPSKGSEPSQCDNVSKCIVKYETVKWLIDIFVFRWLKNINILLEVAISMS